MFNHPHSFIHSKFAELLTFFFFFLLRRKNMPSLPSYGVGPRVIVLYSEFISSGGNFIGHCSHIVQTSLLI